MEESIENITTDDEVPNNIDKISNFSHKIGANYQS